MEFDLENPLTSGDEESMAALFAAESNLTSSVDLAARLDAISIIVQMQYSCNLDSLVAYLAVNYVDRFLSNQQIPREKPWIVRLLAIACLSLATKMKNTIFSLHDIQGKEKLIFDGRTIQRMELAVLGALQWRMRSITPFSFLRFFLAFFSPAHPPLLQAIKARAQHVLLKAQPEIKMLDFKPSLLAAAALLTAAQELAAVHLPAFHSALSACEFVNKEKLWECCRAMADVAAMDGWDATPEVASSALTPVSVLCRAFPSSESERTVGSASDGRDLKKRRLARGLRLPHACD